MSRQVESFRSCAVYFDPRADVAKISVITGDTNRIQQLHIKMTIEPAPAVVVV